jgi:hypothetical protein
LSTTFASGRRSGCGARPSGCRPPPGRTGATGDEDE